MTQLSSGDAASVSRVSAGIQFKRVWTRPSGMPYSQVDLELRDIVLRDWRTGELVFEQRDVEFPTFWSQNASSIVATKYFRGALGTREREWSLRQLIDRVVHTYRNAGVFYGYFGEESADIFADE